MTSFDDKIRAEGLAVERVRRLAQASQLPELALTEIWRARTIDQLRHVVGSLKPSELRSCIESTISERMLQQSIRPLVSSIRELADEADDEDVEEPNAA